MKNNYLKKHAKHGLNIRMLSLAIAAGLGLWPLTCWSGTKNEAKQISDNLTEWIKSGSFTYDSKAHTYKTDSRYVFSGGEYSIRTPVYRINPISVSLPDINVGTGCSGIDLYMGSFSFITKEELKNFAKAAVKGAPIYAFNLALNSMDPDIKNEIDKLHNLTHMLSAGQLDSCTAAQYSVNSIATLFHNERVDKQIGDRSIQHMWDSLKGVTPKSVWDEAVKNDYIPFAGTSKNDNSEDSEEGDQKTTVKDDDLTSIASARRSNDCKIATDNVEASNGNTDCEITSLNQAMGYESNGEFGNLMRLSSLSWISTFKNKYLYKNSPLFPNNMSDEEIRSFVYSLFGTSYMTFTKKSNDTCVADGTSNFSSKEHTLKGRILIEGGTYNSIKSQNPTNSKSGKGNCWLIDTEFTTEATKWESPGKYILEKLGDFGSVKYTNANGMVDPTSDGYKKLSEETILGNVYFSTSRDQGSIRGWTDEESTIINIFPNNFRQALTNKEGANSPLLVYTAAKTCIKPILAESYKGLFKEMKDAIANSINDFPSGRINQANKDKTLAHLDQQYTDLAKELDDLAGGKDALGCLNGVLATQNGTVDQPTLIK